MKPRKWPRLQDIHTIIFDFDGVFTDNKVYVLDDGREAVRCDRADGLAISMLRRRCQGAAVDVGLVIVSTERNAVVGARAQKLCMECHQGVGAKLEFIAQYLAERRPRDPKPFRGLVYLGNDLNDLPVIERAGFSVVPNDAHPLVKRSAGAVLPQNGGDGFVRAAVERFIGLGAMTMEETRGLVSDR